MAYSQEIWKKAKALFLLGKSLQEIANECDIKDRTSISRRAKKEGWEKAKNQQLKSEIMEFEKEKSTLEAKKSTLVEKMATLDDFDITILDEQIEKETGTKSLLFSTTNLALIRNNQLLTKNKKTVMMKTGDYEDGKKVGDNYEPFEIDLSPSDIKEIVESTDKASITLGVNQRHAQPTKIDNINAQQNNTEIVGYGVKVIEKGYEK